MRNQKKNYSHMFNYEFHMIKSELNVKFICQLFIGMQEVDKYINIQVNLLHTKNGILLLYVKS